LFIVLALNCSRSAQVRRAHYHLIPRRLSEINQWLRIGDEALTAWTQRGATFSEWLQKSLADKTVQPRFSFQIS
jgi:hypothetical protein